MGAGGAAERRTPPDVGRDTRPPPPLPGGGSLEGGGRPGAALAASAAAFLLRAAGRALDLLFPGFCRECGRAMEGPEPFCPACRQAIPARPPACPRCGQPRPGQPGAAPEKACGGCAGRSLEFEAAAWGGPYEGPFRTAILAFKYLGDQGLRSFLGEALERSYRERFGAAPPQAVVPVPGHPWRTLLRGRDPVAELAAELGRRVGLPLAVLLARARWIRSQTSLPRERRLLNPRGAYAVRRIHRPRRGRPSRAVARDLLLLDDVFTTGATASECARVLKEAGASRVLVLTAARSLE